MKKIVLIILCLLFILSPVTVCADSVKEYIDTIEKNKNYLESIYSYLDENTSVQENTDGSVTVSLKSVSFGNLNFSEFSGSDYQVVTGKTFNSTNFVNSGDYTYTTGQTHTKLNYTDKFLYSLLNDEQKEWYRKIDEAVNVLGESVCFDFDITVDRKYYIYYLYMMDNPEHFYLANSVSLHNHGDGTYSIIFVYAVGNQDGENCRPGSSTIRITDDLRQKIIAKKAIFDNKVNEIISTIPANAPEVIKECLIYSKILLSSYYNLSAQWDGLAEDNWTAYGILVNGYGVCESYSEAFQTLCHAVGINCTGIAGTAAGGGHKWNAVKIEGEWYQCDITFDDPIGGDPDDASLYYFNLTDAEMLEMNHDWSDYEYKAPVCTATKYGRDNFLKNYSRFENGAIHYYSYDCDKFCDNCNYERYADEHKYDKNNVCINCGSGTQNGWFYDGDVWFYFKDGNLFKNDWLLYGGKWYFIDSNGIMATNTWKKDSVGWVYLGLNGAMVTNSWTKDSQGWCYVGADGYAVTNCWKKDSIGWIWLDSNGSMTKNKWIKDGGKWYFLNSNGYMASNQWKKDSVGWVYLTSSGAMLTNSWVKDSKGWCYVGADGYAETNCWKKDSIGWIWLNSEGSMTKSQWLKYNNDWYYLDVNGYMAYNTTLTIGGVKYTFNSNGVWVK